MIPSRPGVRQASARCRPGVTSRVIDLAHHEPLSQRTMPHGHTPPRRRDDRHPLRACPPGGTPALERHTTDPPPTSSLQLARSSARIACALRRRRQGPTAAPRSTLRVDPESRGLPGPHPCRERQAVVTREPTSPVHAKSLRRAPLARLLRRGGCRRRGAARTPPPSRPQQFRTGGNRRLTDRAHEHSAAVEAASWRACANNRAGCSTVRPATLATSAKGTMWKVSTRTSR
jgi:hypothetical protein